MELLKNEFVRQPYEKLSQDLFSDINAWLINEK